MVTIGRVVWPSLVLAILVFGASGAVGQEAFVNFESPVSKGIQAVGDRLYVVNTPDNRLSVFDLSNPTPVLVAEIHVGLDPVAVQRRPGTPPGVEEVWVVNHLSDDVSVVDVNLGIVIQSIPTEDEPADLIFSIDGAKAYVTASQPSLVHQIDASTRQITNDYAIDMEEPRGLTITPNGKFVVIASFESGNNTTVVEAANAPPSNPQVGDIIPDTDPMSTVTLPDKDIWAIKVNRDRLLGRQVKGVGTINFAVGIHPLNGRLYVPNTEALNLVKTEALVRGHIIDSRVTIVRKQGPSIIVTPVDLNPTIDYGVLPNPGATAIALSQPTAVAFDPQNGNVFVAAFGSAKVGILDEDGVIQGRVDVGMGPRALTFDEPRRRVYVLNRLDNTVTAINANTFASLGTMSIGKDGFDPTPEVIREGRPFLYDATLSGNGTASCATCHVDATWDHLAWDLGDPMSNDPQVPGLKGPMVTQSLRGLEFTEPLHWRGDRPSFLDFAPAFQSLLGAGADLASTDMEKFRDFIFTVQYPPNPNMNRDRTFTAQGQAGLNLFVDPAVFGSGSCKTCHAFPLGSSPLIVPGLILFESQDFNVALLRGSYDKTGFDRTGFAFLHDGSDNTLQEFLSTSPPFPAFTAQQKDELAAFVLEFDARIAPAVGWRVTIDPVSANDAQKTGMIDSLIQEGSLVHADLVGHGVINGAVRGLFYDQTAGLFVTNVTADGGMTWTTLRNLAQAGNATVTLMGVPVGSGIRIGIDRDNDALPDGDEAAVGADPLDPDTDNDGHLDGIEVLAGSDPSNPGSVPGSVSEPQLTAVSFPATVPLPGFERLRFVGTGIRHGAAIELDGPTGTIEFNLFPTGPTVWETFVDLEMSGGSLFHGITARVRNRDGGISPNFVIP